LTDWAIKAQPSAALRDAIARDFGSFERWRTEFIAMGKALGGGSGWVLLSWSPRDHCHTLAGGTPILALDMYEHSYQMDFRRQGGQLRRLFYGRDPLAKCRTPFQSVE
jgi:Fe-Mn family superoxide dismutase